MTDDLKKKRVLIYDHGLFVWLAQKLAPHFASVSYFTPWDVAFPHPSDVAVGQGLDGVERVFDFFDALNDADVVVFPDVGAGDLQEFLRDRGHRVWGSAGGQWLELDRVQSAREMKKSGIRRPPTARVLGISALRELVDKTTDRWIKISLFRGAFETTHHTEPLVTNEWLKVIDRELGPLAEQTEFVVESPVDGVEIGWDCHCVDGKYPDLGFYGIEVKDKAIVGMMKRFDSLPPAVRRVYDDLSPALAEGKYRNYFSVEMRLDKKGADPVVIDPCCRFGSPCTEAWAELCGNLPEIVWQGAGGVLVEPEPTARFAVLAVLNSEWAVSNWTPIGVPDDVRPFVRMKCLTQVDDHWYYVPGDLKMSEIGVVVGTGDSLDEAVDLVKERCKQIVGHKIEAKTDALDEAEKAVEAAEEVGLAFGAD